MGAIWVFGLEIGIFLGTKEVSAHASRCAHTCTHYAHARKRACAHACYMCEHMWACALTCLSAHLGTWACVDAQAQACMHTVSSAHHVHAWGPIILLLPILQAKWATDRIIGLMHSWGKPHSNRKLRLQGVYKVDDGCDATNVMQYHLHLRIKN